MFCFDLLVLIGGMYLCHGAEHTYSLYQTHTGPDISIVSFRYGASSSSSTFKSSSAAILSERCAFRGCCSGS
uniref:Putative secreted peptide n=1 Tax=Anopheles braziliensis TaxID=58242 RepID=A0A2M3ZML8_9DIPT